MLRQEQIEWGVGLGQTEANNVRQGLTSAHARNDSVSTVVTSTQSHTHGPNGRRGRRETVSICREHGLLLGKHRTYEKDSGPFRWIQSAQDTEPV